MPTQLIRKQFLLTEEENRRIEEAAKKEGLSVSNLTRKLHGLEPLEAGGNRARSGKSKTNEANVKRKVLS